MYPIGHVVVACGAAWSAEQVVRRLFGSRDEAPGEPADARTHSLFDYRLVALGALLPDALDKPLAWFILRGRVEDDHLLAHTLLFALVLVVPGLLLAWRGHTALISLAIGVITHRICDPIWPEPETVLWPLYGWTFQHSITPYFGIYMLIEIAAAAVAFVAVRRICLRGRMWPLVLAGEI